ncbi:hypothetical protein D9M70_635660 [compost metagenome]
MVVLQPGDVAEDADGAVEARQHRAVGAGLDGLVAEAWTFNGWALGRIEHAADGHADREPLKRAGRSANEGADYAAYDPAKRLPRTHSRPSKR